MSRRTTAVLAAAGTLAVALVVALGVLVATRPAPTVSAPPPTAPGTPSAAPSAPPATPVTAASASRAFLTDHVDPDGRVVRTDQGGDTVSEGQAYAMLVAVAAGDEGTFRRVWDWTQQNLQRADLLLSWRWADGGVVDPASASDADLDAARALVLAGDAFGDPALTADGVALGRAVLDLETAATGAGRILTAGSWATTAPYAYNPSYASPAATAVLAAADPDPRWAELDAGSRAVTASLLEGAPLPPDWAQVHADGRVDAMPGAMGRGAGVRFGYDAARTPIRFAESCDPADRALAAAMRPAVDRGDGAAELDLGGTPLSAGRSIVAVMAEAAAVAAAGDPAAVGELRDADALRAEAAGYYGSAWDALGRLLLTGEALGGCPPLPEAA